MKTRVILLLCVFFSLVSLLSFGIPFSGCGEEEDPSKIYDFRLLGTRMGCCCDTIKITFCDATAGAYYYWLGLEYGGALEVRNDYTYLHGPFVDKELFITPGYLDNTKVDQYELYLFASQNADDVDLSGTYVDRAGPILVSLSNYSGSTCASECCTGHRNYAEMLHFIEGVEGVEAKILTRYGQLCGEGTSESSSWTWVYCSIGKMMGNASKWAQVGYARFRRPNEQYIFESYYCEVMGDGAIYRWYSALPPHGDDPPYPPQEGTTHLYRCDLNTYTATWDLYCDTLLFLEDNRSHQNSWSSGGGDVTMSAEISNHENDMPGTQLSPCRFFAFQVREANSYQYIPLFISPGDCDSDNASEWAIECDTLPGEVRIWDWNPL